MFQIQSKRENAEGKTEEERENNLRKRVSIQHSGPLWSAVLRFDAKDPIFFQLGFEDFESQNPRRLRVLLKKVQSRNQRLERN